VISVFVNGRVEAHGEEGAEVKSGLPSYPKDSTAVASFESVRLEMNRLATFTSFGAL
jgi:hypothetical protein